MIKSHFSVPKADSFLLPPWPLSLCAPGCGPWPHPRWKAVLLSFSFPARVSVGLFMMRREPSQWKWQVGGEFAFSGISVFILQRFSCFCRSSVYRSTYQGTGIDQVKHLNEALSSFFCVSVNELDRENHSWSMWDLITVIKVKLQRGEGQKIVSWVMLQLLISQLRPLLAEHRDSVCHTQLSVSPGKSSKWCQTNEMKSKTLQWKMSSRFPAGVCFASK